MCESEIRAWRDFERNRINDLVDSDQILVCKNIISLLTAILQDD